MRTIYFTLLVMVTVLVSYVSHAQCTMMIDQDFNHWGDRKYTVADVKSDFNNKVKPWTASTYRGISAPGADASLIGNVKQESWIINGELRAEYTKDDAGGYAGGFLFDPYFDGVEEAYLEYKVKFDDNFFWATGGKLPGLGGSTSGINSETTGRGTVPSGCKYNTNGWSARLMWRRNRAQTTNPYLILYSYFAEKEDGDLRVDGDCGDVKRIFSNLNDDTWYTIRQYIKLNTPGQKDGVVTMWVNGEQTYHNTKEMIRNTGKGNLKINALIMNTYRGGSRTDPVWHSPRDEYAFFDDFKVWTGCSEPPTAANQAPTGSFLEPTINTLEEDYSQLYVKVDASDPDGDDITLALSIDDKEIRSEGGAPYEWGHVSASTDFTFETLGLAIGEHELAVVITDSKGASTTISKTITVERINTPPTVIITSPSNGDVFYVGDEVTMTVDATDDLSVDRVNFKLNGGYHSQDSNPDVLEYSTTFLLEEAGEQVLGARVFDTEGESTELIVSIEVKDPVITSITDLSGESLSVYPNPTSGIVFFSEETSYKILDIMGEESLNGTSTFVDLATLPNGVYVIQTNKGVYKVIKK